MSNPTVSVVIPAYRAAHLIHRPIESLLAQSHPPDEILVIDDGSPDDLETALSRFPKERITLIRKPNGGAASARNQGIEKAQGEWIAFLDADDYWEPQKLERQLRTLRDHPEVSLLVSRYYSQEPGCDRMGPYPEILRSALDRVIRVGGEQAFDLATRVWTTTVLIRRSALGDNRFVSGLEPAEDRDLWVRLIDSTSVYFDSEPLATWVLEPGSLSRSNIDVDCGNMLRVVRRHAALLGPKGLRKWESQTLGRWAGNLLAQGRPREALEHAFARIRLTPLAVVGWWTLLKSVSASLLIHLSREGSRQGVPRQ